MYLKRKVDIFLKAWKADPDRKPLVIKGSRQVGKTESINHFAKEHYESVIEINFVRDEKYKGIISDGYDVSSIIKNISLIDPSKKFIPGKTLIFFDEITEFPEIATCLKFFCIDRSFDVICSGSMLGVNYKKIESNSVGYKKDYNMYSLDFEEFLWAKGYSDDAVIDMLTHMKELKPFSELEMSVFRSLFLDYNILGGMPAVVREYIQKNTFEGSLDTQKQLVADYKEDIRKYATGVDQTRIINVFNRVAPQLARENKKFQIAPDFAITGDVPSGLQMQVWSISVTAWSFRSCRWEAILIRMYSSSILPIRDFLCPYWMMNPRRICAPIRTWVYIRVRCMRIWSVKR